MWVQNFPRTRIFTQKILLSFSPLRSPNRLPHLPLSEYLNFFSASFILPKDFCWLIVDLSSLEFRRIFLHIPPIVFFIYFHILIVFHFYFFFLTLSYGQAVLSFRLMQKKKRVFVAAEELKKRKQQHSLRGVRIVMH